MLTENQKNALAQLNSREGLLEAVIQHIKDKMYKEWITSKPEHIKQREQSYLIAITLDEVARVIKDATNHAKTND